jgi:adenylate cyclase
VASSPAGKKVLEGALVALASTAAASLLWAAGWLDRWEFRTWDWRVSRMARPAPSTGKIRLILLDQQSLDWGQKENGLSWPWPREVYVAILEYLKRSGAKSIAFDVLFTEPSKYGVADDLALGSAIGSHKGFVGALFLGEKTGSATAWPGDLPAVPPEIRGLERWLSSSGAREGVAAARALFPVPEIASRAAILADVQHNPDPDGVYRRVRLFRLFGGRAVPSLALASLLAGSPEAGVGIRQGSMSVAGKTVPIDREGNAILRFRGPSGTTYRQFSAAAVIQSELRLQAGEEPVIRDPDAFRDCHVIFGFSAPGLYDLRSAPVGGVFPGSEIHATALDNLMEGDFLADAAPQATIALTLLLALLSAIPVVFSRSAWKSMLFFAACLPLPVLLSLAAYREGTWLPLVAPQAAVSLSLLGALAVNYATEGKQKRFIKNAFRQYLSPDVIEQIIAHPELLKLGGERRTLSIFFSDLQGFTAIAEGLDPEALTALLNEYLSAMTDIIHEEGGTLDKYVGDAIIAFWNAPLAQPDHAERAARAAVRCQAKLAEMRPSFREKTGKDLFMRIGLNTGVAVVGNMGSSSRFDYTIFGDAVNLASRLEGINKQFGTYLLASEALRSALGDGFAAREISRVAVVGRKEPVRIFELLPSREFAAAREDLLSGFARGLQAFYEGDFPEALASFLAAEKADPPAAAYARKCRALMEHPPERWEGVWAMTEK